jgi:hypothetical protein
MCRAMRGGGEEFYQIACVLGQLSHSEANFNDLPATRRNFAAHLRIEIAWEEIENH